MKIAVRGGHNFLAKGACGLIDETTEDRKVKDAAIKYLKQAGHSVLDVTPSNMNSNLDLAYGVNKATNWGAELFISIHFNKAYDSYNGAIGSEVCVYNTFDMAQRVVNKLGSLGFKNRGQKVRQGLYELRKTSCKAMIVEVCFCEATEDVALYKRLGSDRIGMAIAEGICGRDLSPITSKKEVKKVVKYDDKTNPTGDNVFNIPGTNGYIEQAKDGRLIIHKDRGNYIAIGQGFIDCYWNDNNGNDGHKRLSD